MFLKSSCLRDFFKVCYDIVVCSYDSRIKKKFVVAGLDVMKEDLLVFLCQQLQIYHPRDDYKELLQLALLFLGEESWEAVHINAPRAYRRARWMAKLIYAFKIDLFRYQFHLLNREMSELQQFNVFVVRMYLTT